VLWKVFALCAANGGVDFSSGCLCSPPVVKIYDNVCVDRNTIFLHLK